MSDKELIAREVYDDEGREIQVRHEKVTAGEFLYVQVRAGENGVNDRFRVVDNEERRCVYLPGHGRSDPTQLSVIGVHKYGYTIDNVDFDIEIVPVGNGKLGHMMNRGTEDEEVHVTMPENPRSMGESLDVLDSVMEHWRTQAPVSDDPLAARLLEMGQAFVAMSHDIYANEDARVRIRNSETEDLLKVIDDPTIKHAMKVAQSLHDKGIETTSNLDQKLRQNRAIRDKIERSER